jgi:hypothetical protein
VRGTKTTDDVIQSAAQSKAATRRRAVGAELLIRIILPPDSLRRAFRTPAGAGVPSAECRFRIKAKVKFERATI